MVGKVSGNGLNQNEMYQAVLQALLANTNVGGGGGGGFVAPSLIVTGTASYTVPVGYNARVVASCRQGGSLNINGTAVLVSHQSTWNTLTEFRYPTYTGNGNSISVNTSAGSTGSANLSGTTTAYNATALSEAYNVKSGTVITTNGNCVYCIELYLI